MMNNRKEGLVQLGAWMRGEISGQGPDDADWLGQVEAHNGWFTPEMVRHSLRAHGEMLQPETLEKWWSHYSDIESFGAVAVGCILAGNLPMVGWMDVLCTVLAGHVAHVKTASSDAVILPAVVAAWTDFDPAIADQIQFTPATLRHTDAVLATGSNNTRRYFEHYFSDRPHLLRHQRTGVAALDGQESEADLKALAADVFLYFGLGCRSTTKVFLPEGFDLDRLFAAFYDWAHLANHNKYANNYDYHKAVWLLNQESLLDNGFLLLKEDAGFVSPVGTLYWESYESLDSVWPKLAASTDALQCVSVRAGLEEAAQSAIPTPVVTLGEAQCPKPWDYPDGKDTLAFLLSLSSQA